MDWITNTNGGDGQAIGDTVRPGGSTTNEGCAALLGEETWPAGMLQEGTDFGRDTSLATPTNFTALPAWDAPNRRIFLGSNTGFEKAVITNCSGTEAYINVTSGYTGEARLTDLIIDGDQFNEEAGSISLLIAHDPTAPDAWINAKRITLTGSKDNGLLLRQGIFDGLHIHTGKSDAIRMVGTGPKRLSRSFVRNLGLGGPEVHADVMQIFGEDTGNYIGFNNNFYLPGETSTYWESANGVTNTLRWDAQTGFSIRDVAEVNSLLVGGGYCISIGASVGQVVNGVAIIGCWWGGEDYQRFGNIYPGNSPEAEIGQTRNVLFHNARNPDGSPVIHELSGGNLDGLWNYDKAALADCPNVAAIAQILGYLDSNNDPLVTTKTGLRLGTEV